MIHPSDFPGYENLSAAEKQTVGRLVERLSGRLHNWFEARVRDAVEANYTYLYKKEDGRLNIRLDPKAVWGQGTAFEESKDTFSVTEAPRE